MPSSETRFYCVATADCDEPGVIQDLEFPGLVFCRTHIRMVADEFLWQETPRDSRLH